MVLCSIIYLLFLYVSLLFPFLSFFFFGPKRRVRGTRKEVGVLLSFCLFINCVLALSINCLKKLLVLFWVIGGKKCSVSQIKLVYSLLTLL